MNTVKTYDNVNSEDKYIRFQIAKMETIYALRNGKVDDPHRHNYYTVLIVNKANGRHKIDFNTYNLNKNQIFFVAPGQVHQIIEKNQSIGFSMTFSTQFLLVNAIELSFIESLNLFQNYDQSPPLTPNKEQFKRVEHFANEIFSLNNGNTRMKELSIGAYLKLLLIECNSIYAINPIENSVDSSGNNIIREFKKLVDTAFRQEHSTTYYANNLFISADHLNRVIKFSIGKTAKEYIQSRIITEAKRLLYFSSLSTKEIGFELGFNEPANFSTFFKKHTNSSPSSFKKNEISTL